METPTTCVQCEQCKGDLFLEVTAWRLILGADGMHRAQDVRFFRCEACHRTLRDIGTTWAWTARP